MPSETKTPKKLLTLRMPESISRSVDDYRQQLEADTGARITVSEAYRSLLRSGLLSAGIVVQHED